MSHFNHLFWLYNIGYHTFMFDQDLSFCPRAGRNQKTNNFEPHKVVVFKDFIGAPDNILIEEEFCWEINDVIFLLNLTEDEFTPVFCVPS